MNINTLIIICCFYGVLLFAVAYFADREAKRKKPAWLSSPLIYTLSLSVYCTAWTFYGAVGSAARSGIEFLAIYVGPSLVFFSWWVILRKMVRIGRSQNITSIADFISSRFGKSNTIAVIVTCICLVAVTPYIALQLQSISQSFSLFFDVDTSKYNSKWITLFSATALTSFTILFGTRSVTISERQYGVIVAIAFESIIKILALICVGIFAIYIIGSPEKVFALPEAKRLLDMPIFSTRWTALVSVSFMAVLVLPRMFHVLVTENTNEKHLLTASWAFPLYLLLLNIFVLPIAIVGMNILGPSSNPDYFLITLPLHQGQNWLATLAFIGGFSAATSMIIMTSIAISIMVSNHIAMPIWLGSRENRHDPTNVRTALMTSRRATIIIVMLLSYGYYELAGDSGSLASIGLIAFVGVSQLFPSLMAALFWRGANRNGVIIAMIVGTITWLYTLYWPSLGAEKISVQHVIEHGPFGIYWLSPHNLFGSRINDPAVHSIFWTLFLNVLFLVFGSLFTRPRQIERLLANQYVGILSPQHTSSFMQRKHDTRIEDIYILSQRVLGPVETKELFATISKSQGRDGDLPIVTDEFISQLERSFSGALGGAAAHALISQLTGYRNVPVIETIQLADETIQNIEYARALEAQSKEIERQAQALREANAVLVSLDAQKDAFLSQVSHELRTPMAAIRSFTEILRDDDNLSQEERSRMLGIIAKENVRLTNMLDELLDISHLESGRVKMQRETHLTHNIVEQAISVTEAVWKEAHINIVTEYPDKKLYIRSDFNRMSQVFINLITNAIKYVVHETPELTISIKKKGSLVYIDFVDNGKGIPPSERPRIFEKFIRGSASDLAGSAGLGLAISREIVENHEGTLELMDSVQGAHFRVKLPLEGEA